MPLNSNQTINLSSYPISGSDITLLNKGLSFIPSRNFQPKLPILEAKDRLIRSAKLRVFFRNKSNIGYEPKKTTFQDKSTWCPTKKQLNMETVVMVKSITDFTDRVLLDFNSKSKHKNVYFK